MWDIGTVDVVLLLDLKMAQKTSIGGFLNGYQTIPFSNFCRNGPRIAASAMDEQEENRE